ncbi:MAG: HNH endonuclease signature motif containing protein [Candidatus Krumholzibacteria bacterium]
MNTLSLLSSKELLSRLQALVQKERKTTLEILLHIAEVESRRFHLKLGYASLWEYCTERLGYSRSAAGRRIVAARCVRRYPELRSLLAKNEMSLMTVSLIAPALNDENKEAILRGARNRTQGEVEALVAQYRTPVAYRDRVRPVRVAVLEPAGAPILRQPRGESQSGTNERFHKAGPQGEVSAPVSGPQIEQKLLIQFLASAGFMKKYEAARSLLSNGLGRASFARVFEAALDDVIERRSPIKRRERREKRKLRKAENRHMNDKKARCGKRGLQEAATQETSGRNDRSNRNSEADTNGKRSRSVQVDTNGQSGRSIKVDTNDQSDRSSTADKNSKRNKITDAKTGSNAPQRSEASGRRPIPAAIRDAVYARDGGRCRFKGTSGRRCGSRNGLEIDHVLPVARGGRNEASNLRLLCSWHNRLEAERLMGPDIVSRFCRNHSP